MLRDAGWLHESRARAYAIMLAAGMALALTYHWVSLVMGHHPGVAAAQPGKPGPTDFVAFWVAGRLAWQGHAASAWNLATLQPIEHATAVMDPGAVLAFFYPPTFLLLCLPFAVLPYLAGFAAFVAAQTAALFYVLRRILPGWGWLPLVSFPGLLLNAATGQNGFISAACFGVPVLLLDRVPWLAGAALGGLAFKPHLAFCVPVALLAARRWQALIAAGLAALLFAALSGLVLGWGTYPAFIASLPAVRDALQNHAEDWDKLQSLYTAARLAGVPLGGAYALQIVLALVAAAALAALCIRRPGAAGEAAALAAASLLCSPHVLDYDLAVAGVPLAWIAREASRTGWLGWEKLLAAAAFIWPLGARVLTQDGAPLGPFILLALFCIVLRRAWHCRPACRAGSA
jgi:hypothetical protein